MSDSSMWDDVPLVAVTGADGRTINPHRTFGPGDQPGVSWEEYFKGIRDARTPPKEGDEEGDDEEFEIVITQEAEEFDEPCGPLATWVKRAHSAGWSIHTLAHAFSTQAQPPFKSGPREGLPRPTKNFEAQWLFIEKAGVGRATVYYLLNDGKVVTTRTRRTLMGRNVSDSELQEVIDR